MRDVPRCGQQAFAAPYGTACGNAAPRLSARLWPVPGSAFAFESSDHDPSTLVAFVAAFTTANLPIGNCTLQVAPGLVTTLQLGDSAGFASQPMALPAAHRCRRAWIVVVPGPCRCTRANCTVMPVRVSNHVRDCSVALCRVTHTVWASAASSHVRTLGSGP